LPGQKPPELGTVGLVQKLINIYVKYEFCWQIVGKWQANPHPGCFAPYAPAISPQDFLCALHAPIDRRVINEVLRLPIGQYLIRAHGLLRSGLIRQSSDNSFQPWSKIDCLRTYYGFQLVFRRLAMATWPNVCACFGSGATMASCGKMFEKEFAGGPKCTGPNWIQITADIPDDIIQQSLLEIEANRESETTSL
jgi:hypothetical protein